MNPAQIQCRCGHSLAQHFHHGLAVGQAMATGIWDGGASLYPCFAPIMEGAAICSCGDFRAKRRKDLTA